MLHFYNLLINKDYNCKFQKIFKAQINKVKLGIASCFRLAGLLPRRHTRTAYIYINTVQGGIENGTIRKYII